MSVDMNQTIQEASLDNLHDIITPEAVGVFPLAPGWIMLGVIVVSFLLHYAWQGYLGYKKAAYKREALKELDHKVYKGRDGVLELLTLARRVAIVAYGRQEVAGLSGEPWWDFMEQHSKATVKRELRETIERVFYDQNDKDNTLDTQEVKAFVKIWVTTHKVDANV